MSEHRAPNSWEDLAGWLPGWTLWAGCVYLRAGCMRILRSGCGLGKGFWRKAFLLPRPPQRPRGAPGGPRTLIFPRNFKVFFDNRVIRGQRPAGGIMGMGARDAETLFSQ